jgi:alkanesulfonate monooxygenase SsuD/methylene tetrahydromethanopterin reductase-like flavin-dependent oxidoreductase (luciferase family)
MTFNQGYKHIFGDIHAHPVKLSGMSGLARQLAAPFPLLAAVGAKTSRVEIGTAVIDMRYENPLYLDARHGFKVWSRRCHLLV